MYLLIIHHDTGVIKKEDKLEKDNTSPGHVYIELKNSQESLVIGIQSWSELNWGDLAQTYVSYQKYIIHGAERLEIARGYEGQNPGDKILHSKAIEITEEQYNKARGVIKEYEQYIGQELPLEKYGVLGNNCTHFVNKVYRSIGLEGDYTRQYRESDIQEINTVLTNKYKTLFALYPGDKSIIVFGSSVEEVAKKYNLDISSILKKEATQGIPDFDAAIIQNLAEEFMFEIIPNPGLMSGDIVLTSIPEVIIGQEKVSETPEEIKLDLSSEEQWSLNSKLRQQVGKTIFSPSQAQKNFAKMEALLSKGANIDGGKEVIGEGGYLCTYGFPAPLIMAANAGEARLVEFLLSKGANPDVIDNRNTSRPASPPLHAAVWKNNFEIIKMLIAAKANIHLQDSLTSKGQTPLELAMSLVKGEDKNADSYESRLKILQILIHAQGTSEELATETLPNKEIEETHGDNIPTSPLRDYSIELLDPHFLSNSPVGLTGELVE
jgi:hypothetical protein